MTSRIAALLTFAACAAALGAVPARAAEMVATPSAQLRCLARAPGKEAPLAYPVRSLAAKEGGTVRVDMTFEAPEAAPRVDIPMAQISHAALVEAVQAYIGGYRMPCVERNAPVRVSQDFVFTPNDGRKVVWTTPVEAGASEQTPECLTHVERHSQPRWPLQMRNRNGKVLLRMEFKAPDEPPMIHVVARDTYDEFPAPAREWAAGLRMPCMKRPFTAIQVYNFRFEGARQVALRDMPLKTFLGATRDLTQVPVFFDFQTMRCPFEVRMKYFRPFEANKVGELEGSVPERRPFLDWLSGLTLDLKPDVQNLVLGDELTIAVPCGTLDL